MVLTSTCQAPRPLQGCVGVQLVGNLVAVCSEVMQHTLGGRQSGVAAHHRAQLVDGRRAVVPPGGGCHGEGGGGAGGTRCYHVDGR